MIGLIGKKLGMTQVFDAVGSLVGVTVLQAGPCTVVQTRTSPRDGYGAVQLGFDERPLRRAPKPLQGHLKKAGEKAFALLREFPVADPGVFQVGQRISAELFHPGEYVDVTGTSKGKGFQGGVRRWNYGGGPTSHGSMFHRAPGSIGASSDPSRVWPGHHMPGHMGHDRVTALSLLVVGVQPERHLLLIRGSVPGPRGGYVLIRPAVKKPQGARAARA